MEYRSVVFVAALLLRFPDGHPGEYLLRFGVTGMFLGSSYTFRRYLDV